MYEQEKPSRAGRILWTIVYICIAAGVTWLVLWLIFWRSPSTDTNETAKKDGQETTQTTKESSTGQTSSTSTTTSNSGSLGSVAEETGQASSGSASSSSVSTTGSSELANTGPESVIIPVALAVAGGTIYYNLRTRRQLGVHNS